MAAGDFSRKTTIYDVKIKAKIHEFHHDGEVYSIAFSNDGSMLAAGDYARKTTIYDVKTKAKIHEFGINCVLACGPKKSHAMSQTPGQRPRPRKAMRWAQHVPWAQAQQIAKDIPRRLKQFV